MGVEHLNDLIKVLEKGVAKNERMTCSVYQVNLRCIDDDGRRGAGGDGDLTLLHLDRVAVAVCDLYRASVVIEDQLIAALRLEDFLRWLGGLR